MEFNNMNQYGNVGMGYGYGGYYPGAPMVQYPMPFKQNNPSLTQEEMKMIQQVAPDKLDITISQTDSLRAICNHKDGTGSKVYELADGSGDVYCPICQCRWDPYNATKEEAKEIVNKLISLMQNAKWVGDYGVNLIRDYFPLIPLLEKFPDLYEVAMKQFNKYCTANGYGTANDAAVYANYNNIMGFGGVQNYAPNPYNQQYAYGAQPQYGAPNPQYGYNGYQPAPGYGYGQPQPGNPYGAPAGYQGAPMTNPMDVNNGMSYQGQPQGYQPQYGAPNPNQGAVIKDTPDGTTTSENKVQL